MKTRKKAEATYRHSTVKIGKTKKHKIKLSRSALSLLLIFVFVVGAFPGVAFAADKSIDEAVIWYENQAIGDPYYNHYVLSDGTSIAVGGTELLRFEKDGKWIDIDNRLTLKNGRYVNTAAPIQVDFAQNISDGTLFSLAFEDSAISFSLLNEVSKMANTVTPQFAMSPEETRTTMVGTALSKVTSVGFEAASSSIRYKNVISGMHIEYSISGYAVSKDITLDSAGAWQDLLFGMDTELKPVPQKDGSIALCDAKGETRMMILAPYMYDAAGEISTDVWYSLQENNGDTVLTLSLNEKWLNAKERVFPVTVDPTVEVTGTTYVTDTMVREGAPTTAYNSMKYAVVGYSTTSSNKTNWGLYTMKSLPASIPGHTASYASLTVRQLSAANGSYSYSNPSVPSLSISARHITSSWVAGATWNTRPTYDSAILDTEYITAATEGQAFEFDITSAVNAWYAGSPNYGILFNRTVDSGSTPNCYTSFYTSEHATAANKPVFLIHFVPLSGGGGGDGFSTAPNLILNSLVSVHVALANEKRYFKFTPSTCGFYTFESSSVTSGDPYAWIYNSSQTQLHYDDDGLGYPNFRITHYLDIGHTYYFAAGCYGSGTGSYSVRLTLREIYYETFIPTKTYYLKDIGSGKFLDIHGPAAQESVHQWDFHGGEQSRWTVQKQSDGFYTIRSEYGSKYYVGISNTSLGVDNIKLYASISDSTRWIAYYNSVGEVIFEPKLAPGKILHAPSNSTGVELQLAWAGWIDNNSKWKLFEHKYEYGYPVDAS